MLDGCFVQEFRTIGKGPWHQLPAPFQRDSHDLNDDPGHNDEQPSKRLRSGKQYDGPQYHEQRGHYSSGFHGLTLPEGVSL